MAEPGNDPPRKKIVLDLDLEQLHPLTQGAEVRLLPSGVRIQLEPGESIFEGARRMGIAIPSTCGGKGTCGRCRVLFPLPARAPTYVERQFIDRADLARGVRLACRSRPTSPLTVTVLPERASRR
jgi:uncharacterized 2Fe-2S/4Fe-4S cluster protein (DUF4445 family)